MNLLDKMTNKKKAMEYSSKYSNEYMRGYKDAHNAWTRNIVTFFNGIITKVSGNIGIITKD